MEELERKLNSNSPATVAWVFSKIIEKIENKDDTANECLELRFLIEKCLSNDLLISDVAGRSILHLVENEIISNDYIFADFITKIKITKCQSNLVNILGHLLLLDMKARHQSKRKTDDYNLCAPQHPYVTVLLEHPTASNFIINRIKCFYNNKEKLYFSIEYFAPVYLYSLCNPTKISSLDLFRQKLWLFLLKTSINNTNIIYNILSWLPLQSSTRAEAVSDCLNEAISYWICNKGLDAEILILLQVSHLYTLAQNRCDMYQDIASLLDILQRIESFNLVNCILLMLCQIIDIISPIYLADLLQICEILMRKNSVHRFVSATLKASLLHWLANRCLLLDNCIDTIEVIFQRINSTKDNGSNQYKDLQKFLQRFFPIIASNRTISLALEVCGMLENSEEQLLELVEKPAALPAHFISDIYHLLCGILTVRDIKTSTYINILIITQDYIMKNAPLSPKLLTILLHMLSAVSEPELQFKILKTLPKLVIYRENIPKVMATLQVMSQFSPDLFTLCLSLVYEAWKIDNKCYVYLENMLIKDCFGVKKWEFYVAKAYVIKEICHTKSHLHGKDMVAHLSKILNDCNDDNGSLPSSIALEGIKVLCRAEIIDIITTWKTLSPKFENDMRVSVVEGLCSLIEEIPALPYVEIFIELNREVVEKLWRYTELGDPRISMAALNSLSKFNLEDICAKMPEKYIESMELQNSAVTTFLLPGKTWIKFLIINGASPMATDFIIKLISAEVDAYLKYVYQVKGPKEPINYGYLPTHSILRGIGEFVKTWVSGWRGSIHDALYIECLRILSVEYSKPLPPLDWCFLQEILHDPRCRGYCIDIASHQVMLSGTARRLIENLLVAVSDNPQENDVISLFRNLKHLAKSIQPSILKPFIDISFTFAINRYDATDNSIFFNNLMTITTNVLKDESIQETNKNTIAQVLSDKINSIQISSNLFNYLIECIATFPKKALEEITNLGSTNGELLNKLIAVRCCIAMKTKISPLSWLDDVIDYVAENKRNVNFLNDIAEVFRQHINNSAECALWLLELIGRIQAKVADRSDRCEICYYFDIFVLAVVEFSGFSIFMREYAREKANELFPSSLAALLETDEWSVCTNQALEWLYHMNNEETIPKDYQRIFGVALRALRHDEEFIKNQKWMKYFGCKIDFDIK